MIKWEGEDEDYATWESHNEVIEKWSNLLKTFNETKKSEIICIDDHEDDDLITANNANNTNTNSNSITTQTNHHHHNKDYHHHHSTQRSNHNHNHHRQFHGHSHIHSHGQHGHDRDRYYDESTMGYHQNEQLCFISTHKIAKIFHIFSDFFCEFAI